MSNYIFSCNDISIKVNSFCSEIIDDLIDMFGDYYNDPITDIKYEINFLIGIPEDPKYMDKEKNDTSYNYIKKNGNSLNVYLPYYSSEKKSFVKRIFTTTWIKVFQKEGYCILHGACAYKDDKGVIITGNAGSGKTTLLIKLLQNGYGFVANDRIAIKKCKDETKICGIPFSMGISDNDISNISDKIDSYHISEISKTFIENKDIPIYFQTSMKSNVSFNTIILCDYDLHSTNLKMEYIPPEQIDRIMDSYVMGDNSFPSQKNYMNELVGHYRNKFDFSDTFVTKMIQGIDCENETIESVKKILLKRRD
ncbi:MAG: hypothetical protein ACI31R_02790 [Bacilli bacterium]